MRKFEPLSPEHPAVGKPCRACGRPFVAGDELTLVPLAPFDPEAQERARAGRFYTAVAVPLHWSCAGPLPVDEEILTVWVIYTYPLDMPEVPFLVRPQYAMRSGLIISDPRCQTAATLEAARALLPPGLTCLPGDPDPSIVECWI